MSRTSLLIAGFTVLLLIALYYILHSVLLYLGLGFVVAIIGRPVVNLLMMVKFKKFKMKRALASLITLLSFYTLIFLVFNSLGPVVFKEIKSIAQISPTQILDALAPFISEVEEFAMNYVGEDLDIKNYVQEKITSFLNLTTLSSIVNHTTVLLGNVFIAFFAISFTSFFFMKDGEYIVNEFLKLIPKRYRTDWLEIQPEIKNKLTRYFVGIFIEVSIVFICLLSGLWVLGLENFVLIALCAAIFNVIPYLGPLIGILIGLIFTVTTGYGLEFYGELLPLLLKVLGIFVVTQLIDNIFLQPYIYSSSINAHPMEVFLVILIAGNTFGVIGMILAIPSYTVIRVAVKEIKENSAFFQKMYD